MFNLNEQLQRDTVLVGEFPLCQLLLMNDSRYPWFILVPKRDEVSEIFHLLLEDQQQLLKEISFFTELLSNLFMADKMNIANLGNVVSQLHIHVIVRYKADESWPAPVWGKGKALAYSSEKKEQLFKRLKGIMPDFFLFL